MPNPEKTTRREFIKKSALTASALSLGFTGSPAYVKSGNEIPLKIGLIGCGRRGTSAVHNLLGNFSNVKLYALADLFSDQVENTKSIIDRSFPDKSEVSNTNIASGFDAFEKIMESEVDLVILATPPAFRPQHFKYAVQCDKHIFMEKPVAIDPAGIKSVLEYGKLAQEKKLSVQTGFQYRNHNGFKENINEIHNGFIGEPLSAHSEYYMGDIWFNERDNMSEQEWMLRNWYYYNWLSGDFIVEQFVHNLDTIMWAFDEVPSKCTGTGGRQVRTDLKYGNIYDHFGVRYTFDSGRTLTGHCRQIGNTHFNTTNIIHGRNGVSEITPQQSFIYTYADKENKQYFKEDENPNIKQKRALINSIRNKSPINDTTSACNATLMGIMGREAAYTGNEISWDELINSNLNLLPDDLSLNKPINVDNSVAKPGTTKLNR